MVQHDHDINPHNFHRVVEVIKGVDDKQISMLDKAATGLTRRIEILDEQIRSLGRLERQLHKEIENTTRGSSSLRSMEDQRVENDAFKNTIDSENFLYLFMCVAQGLRNGWSSFRDMNDGLRPGQFVMSERDEEEEKEERDEEEEREHKRRNYQESAAEFQMNKDVAQRFVDACLQVKLGRDGCVDFAQKNINILDQYFARLHRRHSADGIKIHVSPIVTDVAILVFENIDAHGEIQDGAKPDEISAYSAEKARIIVEAVKTGVLGEILHERFTFVEFLKQNLDDMWKDVERMEKGFGGPIDKVSKMFHRHSTRVDKISFSRKVDLLDKVDPDSVVPKDKSTTLDSAERFDLSFYNDTLSKLARLLVDPDVDYDTIVNYVLERKAALREHDLEINSFYTCRIGQGNPMKGEAAGQLQIIKAKKPNSRFEDIVGDGYGEVGDFIEHIKSSAEWYSLYLATSPRKRADKANVLLIGPQGCGKTEVLRSVGGQEESISIFAQGSDFLTSWMGEAQKNPKRLFEAALKLQKESGRHVHILIDEIDAVLNNDREASQVNLSLEFQQIMDGVVEYPYISVWGTTNSPNRIPMPMIRRFAKVLIVGELFQEDRVKLLKYFVGFMPISDEYDDDDWEAQAKKLEGATGDVIAKIADYIWRLRLPRLIEENPDGARRMKKILKMHSKGNKFDFSEFDDPIDETRYGGEISSHRTKFLRELATVMTIEPDDVEEAIDKALGNVGIINEINTAKNTYADSKAFLAEVRKTK